MIITRRPLLMGAAAAGLMAATAYAQSAADFMGEWNGVLDLGSAQLRLKLAVAEGPTSTLYSIDQGNSAIPVGTTTIAGDRITLAIPVIRASFEGQLRNGRIEGQFTQGGTLPLIFARGEAVAAAPEALTQARLEALRSGIGAPAMAAAALSRDRRRIAFVDGLRAVGHEQRAANSDKWHLGSITKSMTATLVARLAQAGRISWDDTVGGVLGSAIPDMRAEYRDITFRHLCSHRGGLQANIEMADLLRFPRESQDSRADRIAYSRLGLLQAPQGPKESTFMYSNTGYVIAGAMLETKMGAPWEALIQEHVFNPLGMASAGQARQARLAPTISHAGTRPMQRDNSKRIRRAVLSPTIPRRSARLGAFMRTLRMCSNTCARIAISAQISSIARAGGRYTHRPTAGPTQWDFRAKATRFGTTAQTRSGTPK